MKSDLPKVLQGCWDLYVEHVFRSVGAISLRRRNGCGPQGRIGEQVLAGQTEFVNKPNNWETGLAVIMEPVLVLKV